MLTVSLGAGLAACGSSGSGQLASVSTQAVPAARGVGPQADYPTTVGASYEINGTTYTPVETLNDDEVVYLAVDDGAMGYTAAHHTLAFPSYVEVTSLETGRTVLVRVERRGPMTSNALIALSPAAMVQLGASADTPVRVRRVNPPEEQRAMLRSGNAAPPRMDTPMSLVNVLRRGLPDSGTAPEPEAPAVAAAEIVEVAEVAAPATPATPSAIEIVEIAASTASAVPVSTPATAPVDVEVDVVVETHEAPTLASELALPPMETAPEVVAEAPAAVADTAPVVAIAPAPEPVAAPAPVEGGFVVQAASFANADNARRAANVLGGVVSQSGTYYRVRTGPFATRGEAEASLANVRRAGYTDARILTSG